MTNLNNYLNLSPKDVEEAKLGPVTLEAFGSGSGLHGMPGDFTPPSRFVRAAIFSQAATPNATGEDAVLSAFHILNQFDIPKGSVTNSGHRQADRLRSPNGRASPISRTCAGTSAPSRTSRSTWST